MPSGGVLAAVAIAGMVYLGGVQIVHGAKWLGKETKKAGTAIVHVIKKAV